MISITVPNNVNDIFPTIQEIIRRAVDTAGPNGPIVVRLTITGISGNSLLVNTGDIKIVAGGSGLILPSRNGLKFGRLVLENADSNGNLDLSVDPL